MPSVAVAASAAAGAMDTMGNPAAPAELAGGVAATAQHDDGEAEMMEGVCDPEFGIGFKGTRLN